MFYPPSPPTRRLPKLKSMGNGSGDQLTLTIIDCTTDMPKWKVGVSRAAPFGRAWAILTDVADKDAELSLART